MSYSSVSHLCLCSLLFRPWAILRYVFYCIYFCINYWKVTKNKQYLHEFQQTVLNSIQQDDPSFTGDGYTSLAVIYAVFSICNWVAPSIVAVLHAKMSMIIGAVLYTIFIASFLYPLTWLLYVMSAMLGVGAAIIWTAQGNYLTLCSNEQTMSRNSGIFWAILQTSMFLGNSFVFWQFEGKAEIDGYTRKLVFSVLTGVAILGVCCLMFLRTPRWFYQ